jgi:hypothetical protein
MIKKNIIPVALLIILGIIGYFVFSPKKITDGSREGEAVKQNVYTNEEFDFSLVLPDDFAFYTTQRKESEDYIDIEFFMPSSDVSLYQQISGYAKPVVVRVVTNPEYAETLGRQNFFEVGKKDGKIYTLWLWKETPKDWQGKWDEAVRKKISDSFKMN